MFVTQKIYIIFDAKREGINTGVGGDPNGAQPPEGTDL